MRAVFCILLFQNCLGYLAHLGKGQAAILYGRKKISDLVQSENTPEKQKSKLKTIVHARLFALEKLSLNPKGGFEYFTSLDREEVGWHVTASYPLKFESYTWWFPIAGRVPYKGFFDYAMAKELEDSLISEGLDTRLRVTAGYSTLGYFSDPVLSPQLRLKDDELAALVFHEMAHGTVYFSDDSQFNESYASFVEDRGTELYYETNDFSDRKEVLERRKNMRRETDIIMREIKITAQDLKKLYDSEKTDGDKLREKKEIIESFRTRILARRNEFKAADPERFRKAKLNNESFMGALRYSSGSLFFHEKFESAGRDFSKFHEEMKKLTVLSKEQRAELLK
ncbi:MAG TPA: aminopeptidase [Leptospiraceae bacterium]|nr:aminopeptidase [Leptospiraceae bacterium]HNM04398.1 aminopeptidase [Leptospiraceae bacterium]